MYGLSNLDSRDQPIVENEQTLLECVCCAQDSTTLTTQIFANPLSLVLFQEKVEEDRYMREQEKKFFERKKKEMAEKMKEEEAAVFEETIAPAMAEAHVRLEKTGDSVSDAGLESIARWKLDMEE